MAQSADLAEQMRRLEQRIAELEAAKAAYDDSTRTIAAERQALKRRIEELEAAKASQEDAVRTIISDAISSSGSKINDVITLGGTFEYIAGTVKDYAGATERFAILNTVEFDFEIQPNDWVMAKIVYEYTDGTDALFATLGEREVAVDRVNIDTATLTLGNTEMFFPYLLAGRSILPFGISTGEPVADVLTIEDPLTIEVFEMKHDALMIGVDFPTPKVKPQTPMKSPPPVRPRVLNPFLRWLGRALGYKPPVAAPPEETYVFAPTAPAPLSLGLYHYSGETRAKPRRSGWRPYEHFGASAGLRTTGPVNFELDLDYNSSVFDSRFLAFEYQHFIDQIGLIPGAAGNLKANFGPVPLVAEWNGAIEDVRFTDDVGRKIVMRPNAWQVSIGYQFDWNRWAPPSGSVGTYVALGFSQSHDLEGVTEEVLGEIGRVGFVPQTRFLAHVAEWITDSTRFAFEYQRIIDYGTAAGGTGKHADAFTTTLTYEW